MAWQPLTRAVPLVALLLAAGATRGEEAACADRTTQGAALLAFTGSVPAAVESRRLSPEARATLRGQMTAAYLAHRASADGRPLCLALEALRAAHDLGAAPADPGAGRPGAAGMARCADTEAAGRIWNDMLPDLDSSRRLGFLNEDEYGAVSLYFTGLQAALSEAPAISMRDVCLSFLGLWLIYRT